MQQKFQYDRAHRLVPTTKYHLYKFYYSAPNLFTMIKNVNFKKLYIILQWVTPIEMGNLQKDCAPNEMISPRAHAPNIGILSE